MVETLSPARSATNSDKGHFALPEEDAIIFRRITRSPNWLKVLKECPVSMDDLPPRSAEFPKRLKL